MEAFVPSQNAFKCAILNLDKFSFSVVNEIDSKNDNFMNSIESRGSVEKCLRIGWPNLIIGS